MMDDQNNQDDQRVVRALREISFEINPGLSARVKTALFRRAEELAQVRARRRRMLTGLVIALLMTVSGSAAVWEAAVRIAGGRVAPPVLAAGVVIFWALPSLCATLLLLTPRSLAEHLEEVFAS